MTNIFSCQNLMVLCVMGDFRCSILGLRLSLTFSVMCNASNARIVVVNFKLRPINGDRLMNYLINNFQLKAHALLFVYHFISVLASMMDVFTS